MCADSASAAYLANQLGDGGSMPTSALFRKKDWRVADIGLEFAQRFIKQHHYAAGGSNTRVYTHGLYPRGWFWESECVGVAWWIPPTKAAALAAYPSNWQSVLVCSRMAVLDEIPCNAESFLLAHSIRLIDRDRWHCLLSYADDWQGHRGTIYKAAGFTESGKTKPERCYVKDGRMGSRKAGPHTRTHAEMLALGYACVGRFAKTRFIHVKV